VVRRSEGTACDERLPRRERADDGVDLRRLERLGEREELPLRFSTICSQMQSKAALAGEGIFTIESASVDRFPLLASI
jgi:hypothetical protein